MRRFTLLTVFLSLAIASCSTAGPIAQNEYPFVKTGHLVRNNPGFTPGVWYLQYEEPGASGLTMRLSFADDVICVQDGASSPCRRSVFEQGLRVTIGGEEQGDGVVVQRMEIIDDAAAASSAASSVR